MSLSLCTVVRNEAKRLPAMLESVRGLVDAVVMIDNTSTDETVEIARAWGEQNGVPVRIERDADVRGYPGPLYNEVLRMAASDWVLLLDGDEIVTTYGREQIPAMLHGQVEIWGLTRHTTITGGPEDQHFFEWHNRLARNGTLYYPEPVGPHTAPMAVPGYRQECHSGSQAILQQVRSSEEQLYRDKGRGQYPTTEWPVEWMAQNQIGMPIATTPQAPWEKYDGWFDYAPVYDLAVAQVPENGVLVEVGNYLGRSLSYLGLKAKAANKGLRIVGVDWGRVVIDPNVHHPPVVQHHGRFFAQLAENIQEAGVDDIVSLLQSKSDVAARYFEDASVDFVFIDAGHDYEDVDADVEAWLPKVKPGGIIAGHDFSSLFPGVMRKINERFGDRADITFCPGSWIVRL